MFSRRLVFAAACAGMFLFGIVMISLGSLLPSLTTKFAMNQVAAGSLATFLPFGILTGSLVFGPIVDRYGYKMLLVVCTILVGLSLIGIAAAQAFVLLQICILVIGVGGGVLNGATNALVADISTEGRGANLSFLGAFFGIGALGMPVILGLLSGTFSQEALLTAIGVFVLLIAVFFLVIRFPVPKQPQGFPIAHGFRLLKEGTLILLGFILFFESGMEGMVNNWTTTFLQDRTATTTERALFALSCLVAGLTLARLVLSRVLKVVSKWTALFLSVALVLIGVVLLVAGGSYVSALGALVLIGVGFAAVFPVVLGTIGDAYADLSGTAFSIAFVIALVGNMILNFLVGVFAETSGIRTFPVIVLISLFLMFLLVLAAKHRLSTASHSSSNAQ